MPDQNDTVNPNPGQQKPKPGQTQQPGQGQPRPAGDDR